jgi:hypothetical protein
MDIVLEGWGHMVKDPRRQYKGRAAMVRQELVKL